MGKSEQRELENRMAVLLANLLKWQHQPERQGNSWLRTIKVQRKGIASRLRKTPSLKPDLQNEAFCFFPYMKKPIPIDTKIKPHRSDEVLKSIPPD